MFLSLHPGSQGLTDRTTHLSPLDLSPIPSQLPVSCATLRTLHPISELHFAPLQSGGGYGPNTWARCEGRTNSVHLVHSRCSIDGCFYEKILLHNHRTMIKFRKFDISTMLLLSNRTSICKFLPVFPLMCFSAAFIPHQGSAPGAHVAFSCHVSLIRNNPCLFFVFQDMHMFEEYRPAAL